MTNKFETPEIIAMKQQVADLKAFLKTKRQEALDATKGEREAKKALKDARKASLTDRYKPLQDYFGDLLLTAKDNDDAFAKLLQTEKYIQVTFAVGDDGDTVKISLKALPKEVADVKETV